MRQEAVHFYVINLIVEDTELLLEMETPECRRRITWGLGVHGDEIEVLFDLYFYCKTFVYYIHIEVKK